MSSRADNRWVVGWTVFAVVYVLSLVLSAWLVIWSWEPADGPRSAQWAFALGVAAALGLIAAVSALPLWLEARNPGWYVAAAAFAAICGLAATMLTFGLLFVPSLLLLLVAALNVFGALRSGGLGRGRAVVGVLASLALVVLLLGVYLPFAAVIVLALAAVAVVAARGRPRLR